MASWAQNVSGPSRNGPLDLNLFSLQNVVTVEPPEGDRPVCRKKWSPTGGGLSWEVLRGNKRA